MICPRKLVQILEEDSGIIWAKIGSQHESEELHDGKNYWMLREAEVALAQGMKVGEICRKLEVSEQSSETNAEQELLNTARGHYSFEPLKISSLRLCRR